MSNKIEHGGSEVDSSLKSGDSSHEIVGQQTPRRSKKVVFFAIGLGSIILLALVLGLGLGLGLRKKDGEQKANQNVFNPNDPPANVQALSTIDPSQQMLSSSWDVHSPAQIREYNWTISQKWGAPAGLPKLMLVVNGIAPGPLVEANVGDNIVVHVTNNLPNVTSIHWHGQYQNGTNGMDGTYSITECGIAPGTTFTYNWTVQQYGTYWWHAHHGLQYTDGIYGPLILHSPNDPLHLSNTNSTSNYSSASTVYDGDQIIIGADLYNNPAPTYLGEYQSVDGPPGGELGDEPVPDCGVVNGLGVCAGGEANSRFANLTNNFQAGKTYRFRFINAGTLGSIRFALDNHTMTVVEADGTAIEPQEVQSVTAMVAQRYSVLITMNQQPGAYYFHADQTTDMFAYSPADLVLSQSAILRYAGIADSVIPNVDGSITSAPLNSTNVTQSLDDTTLVPLIPQIAPLPTSQQELTISFGLGSDDLLHAFLNQTSWGPDVGDATLYDVVASQRSKVSFQTQQLVITNDDIVVWDIILNNQDDGDHPVHLHGYNPWILGQGQGHYLYGQSLNLSQTFNNPIRRDTFRVPVYGWTVARVVLDNPGIWAFHCHIGWHMEVGFMSQLNVLPSQLALQPINPYQAAQCGKASLASS